MLGHKPFLVLADYLTRQGDRGCCALMTGEWDSQPGISDGNHRLISPMSGGSRPLLKNDRNVRNIGLIGHSEGGMVAPLVASRSGDVSSSFCWRVPGCRGDHILLEQQKEMGRVTGDCRGVGLLP